MEKLTKDRILKQLLRNNDAIEVVENSKCEQFIVFQEDPYDTQYPKRARVNKDIILAGLLVERECLNAQYEELVRGEMCGTKADFVTVDENIMLLSKAAEMMEE